MKRKGIYFERDLLERLWKHGFAAVRVAGSGATSHPSPDIVAGNGLKFIALEVKMRRNLPLYLPENEVNQLVDFSRTFGAEPYLALKLPRKDWKFLPLSDLKRTSRGYMVDEENYLAAMKLEQILGT